MMREKFYTLAIVLLVLGVSSCKLGKHYSGPNSRLPENRSKERCPIQFRPVISDGPIYIPIRYSGS